MGMMCGIIKFGRSFEYVLSQAWLSSKKKSGRDELVVSFQWCETFFEFYYFLLFIIIILLLFYLFDKFLVGWKSIGWAM